MLAKFEIQVITPVVLSEIFTAVFCVTATLDELVHPLLVLVTV
jgi:hypothetical protein